MSQTKRELSTRWRNALDDIAKTHGLTLGDLREKHRFKAFVEARRECYAYLYLEGWSTPEIGSVFNRDHTATTPRSAGRFSITSSGERLSASA